MYDVRKKGQTLWICWQTNVLPDVLCNREAFLEAISPLMLILQLEISLKSQRLGMDVTNEVCFFTGWWFKDVELKPKLFTDLLTQHVCIGLCLA